MSKKNLKLAIILVILVATAYIYQGPFQTWREKSGKADNFLAGVKLEDVIKYEVKQFDQVVVLEKTGDKWKVGGTKDFFAKDLVMANIKNSLDRAIESSFELASTNSQKKNNFQTDESGIEVKMFDKNGMVVDFMIGKLSPDYISTYVSKSDINQTYSVKTNLYSAFNQTDWRDNTIFKNDKDAVSKIRFQYPDREFIVEKKDDKWVGVSPKEFEVKPEKIDPIVEMMVNIQADYIPEQTFGGTGLEKNLIIIQATGDGIDNTFMVGDPDGSDLYYAKKGSSDNIYSVLKDKKDLLDIKIEDLQ